MDLLELIKQMEEERIEAKITPSHITYTSLLNRSGMKREELSSELNKLYKDGAIEVGKTINDKYITRV